MTGWSPQQQLDTGDNSAPAFKHKRILWLVALWIEGTSVRLIEHVVILGSAAMDRRHQPESDRAFHPGSDRKHEA
jgi:hypothetical protein